ncbi:hypothetical protein [Paenibacillus ginsengarvi]|uniref:Uncharacterized protein n=1 Tax=Paenibacillus ginsengarvi TaxID=400777 RepID=A0A3B0C0J5_9BACL|nr:hypothetical protein [Paenibacillus ginsengarvi]RKN78870.1 hypothetical protein D7M11_22615 [Paenibacillus ginsengarvi]
MIIGLLSIIGTYGLAIALVHLVWYRWRRSRPNPIHYVLITRNNALHIEWYLRTLLFVSQFKAREVHIVVIDEQSEDETVAIVERMAATRTNQFDILEWSGPSQLDEVMLRYANEEVVLVRLSNAEELQNLPLFQ